MNRVVDKGRKLGWLEACSILGCSRRQFYRLIEKGILPAYRLEGCKRGLWVYENDLLAVQKSLPDA